MLKSTMIREQQYEDHEIKISNYSLTILGFAEKIKLIN